MEIIRLDRLVNGVAWILVIGGIVVLLRWNLPIGISITFIGGLVSLAHWTFREE